MTVMMMVDEDALVHKNTSDLGAPFVCCPLLLSLPLHTP
jgi:hypothetical protein